VNVPPYCGVPRLSHQFPVEVVVTAVVTTAVDVVVVGTTVAVDVTVVTVVAMDAVVAVVVGMLVVDELHDAKTSDITIRQVSPIQINLFFIQTSL
jgi:molybdenum cofactor biosynthesis enzyme